MVEDAIGLIILVIAAVVLVMAVGFGMVFSIDLLASAVSWIGQGPVVGCAIVGAVCGSLIGTVNGMRLRGKSDDLRKVYAGAGIALGFLLAGGIVSPAGRVLLGW